MTAAKTPRQPKAPLSHPGINNAARKLLPHMHPHAK
jgi:hypothetical protein